MISGKGMLITVLTASAAAAIVGSMLTKERGQSIKRFVDKIRDLSGTSKMQKSDTLSQGEDLASAGHA